MYQPRRFQFVGPDPLLGILPSADPVHLDALAAYFEHQAATLRLHADMARDRLRNAQDSRRYRARAKARFTKIGARCHVLARMMGELNAIAEMGRRECMALEEVRFALARWRKEKAKRRKPRCHLARHASAVFSSDRPTT